MRGLAQCAIRLGHRKEEFFDVGEAVLHRQLHIDDVFVLGQHGGILGHRANAGDVDHFHGVDRPRHMPAQARLIGLNMLTKSQHHAALLFIDHIEAGQAPEHDQRADQQQHQPAGNAAAAARRRQAGAIALAAPQGLLEALEQCVKIGRLAAAAAFLGALIPRVLVGAGFIPSHSDAVLQVGGPGECRG